MIGEFSHYDRKYLILVKTKDNSSGKVLIELFKKFAEHEAEPRTNARASALASVLQTGDASSTVWTESILPECREVLTLSPFAARNNFAWVTASPPNPPASGRASFKQKTS